MLFQIIEYFHVNSLGMLTIQTISTLFRDSHCPSPAKDLFTRLLLKCLVAFGADLSVEYLSASGFSSVCSTVVAHSVSGQWKKIKNVLKTLSK
mmetsp:Transcript_21222/g.35746  ORF Transcript_21222/g.35746 Transcript_21222/m.35746 type:complete len:93 (-) Transcript_21222:1766-2044(-)